MRINDSPERRRNQNLAFGYPRTLTRLSNKPIDQRNNFGSYWKFVYSCSWSPQ
ncbi:hypothetical protein NZD89_06285 [Alicyclobacillus fastidiosus]|uniref:Uncharacterized protein n=1 Tax=Alicyclobacillus fastidiosus TaxID=392011 RepID=A0ABY6ZLP1_9BACL|nr:hypothetical protein [Alicyclobacillus fastidiosus]WAH43019.1 hypothetical protein NZD89_06285 [Alicyclobacillus fastidiosus]